MINTLVATWRREGIDAWTRRHPDWSSLPWMLAMCGAGLSTVVALLVSGGSNTARSSALNTCCVVGLWPLLCYCVVGRRISFRFVRHMGATIELAEGVGRTVPEHRVWWRERAAVVALPAAALTAVTASGVAYATSSQANLSELGWWLLVASAALGLAAFLALRATRDRRELAFQRAVWTDAETSADQRVVALATRSIVTARGGQVEAPAQVVIGVDAHKRTHTLVAADELGRERASRTVAASADGHLAATAWAGRWTNRRWALEDCRHLTRTLEADLLRTGE